MLHDPDRAVADGLFVRNPGSARRRALRLGDRVAARSDAIGEGGWKRRFSCASWLFLVLLLRWSLRKSEADR